jgi:hypothetical protein
MSLAINHSYTHGGMVCKRARSPYTRRRGPRDRHNTGEAITALPAETFEQATPREGIALVDIRLADAGYPPRVQLVVRQ